MTTKSKNQTTHKPNHLAIGMVLGVCFMVAMQNPAFIIIGLIIGVVLDRRQRQS